MIAQEAMSTAPRRAEPPEGKAWHHLSAEEVLAQLGSAATGLSASEAAQRLATNGPNELKEGKRISALQIFLGQFKSLIIWILIVAGGVVLILTVVALSVLGGWNGAAKRSNPPRGKPPAERHDHEHDRPRISNKLETTTDMNSSKTEAIVPICGMTVNTTTALHAERDGKAFYFCSGHCREKFQSTPAGAKPDGKSGCCGG